MERDLGAKAREDPYTIRLTFTGFEPISYEQAMAAATAANHALSDTKAIEVRAVDGAWVWDAPPES